VAAEPLRLLLEGRPGAGKTTVVARVVELLRGDGLAVAGFLTREVREGGERVGFALETLDGERSMLAHVGVRGGARVGRYRPQTKGKVESDVPYVRERLPRAHAFGSYERANHAWLSWSEDVARERIHGTHGEVVAVRAEPTPARPSTPPR
jgi:hypothetical protein